MLHVDVCERTWTYVYTCAGTLGGQKRVLEPWELAVGTLLTWVLEAEVWSSTRAMNTLNC